MARVPDIRRAPLKRTPYTRTTAGAAAPCVAGGLVSRIPYLAIYLPWGGGAGVFCPEHRTSSNICGSNNKGGGRGGVGRGGRARAMGRANRCPRAGKRPVALGHYSRLIPGALYSHYYARFAPF